MGSTIKYSLVQLLHYDLYSERHVHKLHLRFETEKNMRHCGLKLKPSITIRFEYSELLIRISLTIACKYLQHH